MRFYALCQVSLCDRNVGLVDQRVRTQVRELSTCFAGRNTLLVADCRHRLTLTALSIMVVGAALVSENTSPTGSQHRVHLIGLHDAKPALLHISASSVTVTEPTGEV